MTTLIKSNGDVAENSISGKEAHALPEIYATTCRDLKNVAYTIADATGDSDAQKYAELLNNLSIEGVSFGKLQGAAIEEPLSNYLQRVGFSAVPMEEPEEWEKNLLRQGDILSNVESTSTWWDEPSDVTVPIGVSGEKLPVFVLTNESNEKAPTFEDAKETLATVLERIEEIDVSDVLEDSEAAVESKNKNTPSSDSDPMSVNDPTQIDHVGEATVERIESNGFEIVPAPDVQDHIEVEPFEFEESDEQSVPTLMTSDVKERYMEVKEEMDEMDEMDSEIVKQRIISGDLHDAVDTIEDYE